MGICDARNEWSSHNNVHSFVFHCVVVAYVPWSTLINSTAHNGTIRDLIRIDGVCVSFWHRKWPRMKIGISHLSWWMYIYDGNSSERKKQVFGNAWYLDFDLSRKNGVFGNNIRSRSVIISFTIDYFYWINKVVIVHMSFWSRCRKYSRSLDVRMEHD